MKLLKFDIIDLFKKYRKNIVFNRFNYQIDNTKINFLVSPNGFGKSTLIKIMLNLTKYKGDVITNCNTFSYCPEKVLLPEFLSVFQFLKLFEINDDTIKYYLDLFGLSEGLRISNLSKGMHQKIILIQSLAVDVDAYFFDEPLNGLDYKSERVFINELKRLFNANKLIVISTHYVERYLELPHNIVELCKNA